MQPFACSNLLPVSIVTFLVIFSTPTSAKNLSFEESSSESNLTSVILENATFFEENSTYLPNPAAKPLKVQITFQQNSEFCVKNHEEQEGTVNTEICVPKCCPEGKVLDYGGARDTFDPPTCQSTGGVEWSPVGILLQDSSNTTNNPKNVTIFHKTLNCPTNLRLYSIHANAFSSETEDTDSFHIFPNGTIHSETGLILSPEHCLDGVQNFLGNGYGEIPPKFSGNHAKHVALGVCFPQEAIIGHTLEHDRDSIHLLLYWIILPFASLFLLATIVIYILVWDTHNIHGYTLFSYVLSLFGNYLVLFISQIDIVSVGTTVCAFIGICTHFFFLMTAAWLTIVNFDVWHTFRHLKAGRPKKNLGRYMAYFAFAVGAPFILVFISGVVDNFFKDDTDIILPNYGISCVLSNQAVAFYLYIPLGILVCANLTFFISTIFLLLSYQRSIGAVLKGTCTEKEDQSLRLFLKLFVVMGFSWTFEVVGWGIKKGVGDSVTAISIGVAIVDVFNLLLAIPIFFIFVWKKAIFDQLWIGYPTTMRKPLSLLVFCGCVDSVPEDKRPSLSPSGITMTTLGRNGSMTKRGSGGQIQGPGQIQSRGRLSSGSVSELLAHRNRTRSTSNASQSESGRKYSQGKRSLSNSEAVGGGGAMIMEEGANRVGMTLTLDDGSVSPSIKEEKEIVISHNPNDTEIEPCPKI